MSERYYHLENGRLSRVSEAGITIRVSYNDYDTVNSVTVIKQGRAVYVAYYKHGVKDCESNDNTPYANLDFLQMLQNK